MTKSSDLWLGHGSPLPLVAHTSLKKTQPIRSSSPLCPNPIPLPAPNPDPNPKSTQPTADSQAAASPACCSRPTGRTTSTNASSYLWVSISRTSLLETTVRSVAPALSSRPAPLRPHPGWGWSYDQGVGSTWYLRLGEFVTKLDDNAI